jgi:hypothetical protein
VDYLIVVNLYKQEETKYQKRSQLCERFFCVLSLGFAYLHLRSVIVLNEVLQEMEHTNRRGFPMPFSMEVMSFNRNSPEKAGKIKIYENAVLCTNGGRAISKKKSTTSKTKKAKISQNHFINSTRNIELPSGNIEGIHIWLIRKFNGEKVVWSIHG